MKAAYIEHSGPPEAIQFGDLATPPMGADDATVKVTAVTVNPVDTYIRSGAYQVDMPFPFVIGRDMTGVVVECGRRVSRFRPGDRVWCNNQGYAGRQGTFSELVVVEERLLYPLPSADPIATVAVVHSGLTAAIGLFERAHIESGETVFVNGGDGNVGTAVLQLAKGTGARVAVTAGTPEKAEWCRELGAHSVIDYKHDDVTAAVRAFAPEGVDVYWDASAALDLDAALAVIAHRGRIVVMSGLDRRTVLRVGAFYTRNCSLFGFTVTDATVDELSMCATRLNDAIARGALRARIHSVVPLSHAAEAHRLVERGGVFGKIVLVPE